MKLTENRVQQLALGFIQSYYKHRPSKEGTPRIAGFDYHAEGGIVVDGHLSFVEPDGKSFMATLEATSSETDGEVRYTTQHALLFWDAGAMASLAAAALFSYGYAYNHFTIKQIGLFPSLGILLGTFLGVIALYVAFFRFLTRYRYIYAVEQFKRYHADEQWVAIGEDVFESEEDGFMLFNPLDKNFLELKKQCVSNGFGLMIVSEEGEIQKLATPARRTVLRNRDRALKYMQNNKVRNAVRKAPFLEKFWARTKSVLGIRTTIENGRNYGRFQKMFYNQLILGTMAAALVAAIFYQELKDADIIYVDENNYMNEMEELKINVRPEPNDEDLDSTFIVQNLPDKKPPTKRKDKTEEALTKNQKNTKRPPIAKKPKPKPPKTTPKTYEQPKAIPPKVKTVKTDEVIIYTGKDFLSYDCARLIDQSGRKYVIVEGIYADAGLAKRRIRSLARENMTAHAFWQGCYVPEAKGYLVYIEAIFEDKAVAEKALASYRNALQVTSQKQTKLSLKTLLF